MPFNISGGIEDDEDVPELVDSPPDSDEDDNNVQWLKKPGQCPGRWAREPCSQSSFDVQADRWMEHSKDSGIERTFKSIERLLICPFLFQQLVIPEKWVRWAKSKDMVSFDLNARKLFDGNLPRRHYLVVKMLCHGLHELRKLTEKKNSVTAIMKMMYSIRNVPSTELDRAIKETKRNEFVKILENCILTEIQRLPSNDRVFFDAIDRVLLTVLLCLRQFAEVVHIVTCEGRDIDTEVQNQLTNHRYRTSDMPKLGREKGNSLYKAGKFHEAISVYTDAITASPFYCLLYSNRCQALIKLKEFESAFADAYRTVVLKPDWVKGYYKVVQCLGELGYFDEASEWESFASKKFKQAETKCLRDLMNQIESQRKAKESYSKKKSKKKKKKQQRREEEDDDVPELVSDDEFDECPVIMNKLEKEEEEKRKREEQRKKEEEIERRQREEKEKREREIRKEYEQYLEKASEDLLKSRFADACKGYKIAIDFVDKHREIPGYGVNDFATLLYTRGVSSQKQGSPVEINISKQYFCRVIDEHKTFSHLCMAYFADAKSTYLLNDFDYALKQVRTALQLIKKFPIHGLLTWSGSSENIPESDESYLRREMQVLLQQCKVPPIPSAVCRYQDCSDDNHRKEIYLSDVGFEGYFEVKCDWRCILNFHLKCWTKLKQEHLDVSKDKDVLDTPCLTPDCYGKINLVKMFDERGLEKKIARRSPGAKKKEIKPKQSKYDRRTSKSEANLERYKEIQEEKKRKKRERDSGSQIETTKKQDVRTKKNTLFNGNIPADKDLSEARIYVKSSGVDNAQNKTRAGNNRRVAPVSFQQFCSSLPGYHKDMSIEEVDEAIERAKSHGIFLPLPDDLRVEIDQFEISLGDEEQIRFTDNEKTKMPFLYEYFVHFFTSKGPQATTDDLFAGQLILLPDDMQSIVKKCGGLLSFLNFSPLFIQVPPYIGIHPQRELMKGLIDDHHQVYETTTPRSSVDMDAFDFGQPELSQFAKEFYKVGASVGESDILNLTGGDVGPFSSHGRGEMYKLDHFPEPKRWKSSQNSETSSMYSLDDVVDARSEGGSQASCDVDKSSATSTSPRKNHVVLLNATAEGATNKQVKKKKLATIATQTEGKDDSVKDKEAVTRLQERLEEMQDDFTKLKRTSQTREESLSKRLEEALEREKTAVTESENMKVACEVEMGRATQMKKQYQEKAQIVHAKMEEHRARERELEMKLAGLMREIQHDREVHVKETIEVRKTAERKDKEANEYRRRAVTAEIDLMKTKEAYHVGPHLQAKSHCEQGVLEFDKELARLATVVPDHVLQHFKLARKQWADNVTICVNNIETLKAAYAYIIGQVDGGRPLAELPAVPDLKPPPPGPNPRHIMIQLQRGEMGALASAPAGGKGDVPPTSKSKTVVNNTTNSATGRPSTNRHNPSPLPAVTKKRVDTPPVATPSQAPSAPVGSEQPKPPRKKNFVQLVDKLCKNLPRLTRDQVEICAQQVRTENKGLTGLLYEEIEKRIREMVGLQQAQTNSVLSTLNSSSIPGMRKTLSSPSVKSFASLGRKESDFWDIEDEAVCPICCDSLKDGKVTTLECEHKFHHDCISQWMKKQRTCPNCRKFMADTSEFPSLGSQPPPGPLRNYSR